MKKISIITSAIFVFTSVAFAQSYRPATPKEQEELIKNISRASEQLKTLRADFVQKKTISILADELPSEGKLSFKQPDKLCWEYIKPYQYRFTMNGDKVKVNSEKNTNIIDAKGNRLFNEISKIIISGINGSGIFDDKKFSTKFSVGAGDYQVELTPKQKELKQTFNSITITFNKNDYSVNTVELKEANGDATHITMKNKQFNIALNDEIFAIR